LICQRYSRAGNKLAWNCPYSFHLLTLSFSNYLAKQSSDEVKAEIVRYFETVRRAEIMKNETLEKQTVVMKDKAKKVFESVS
jgi:hypothetical protein